MGLEGLMDRRRLMDASRDWLKVFDVEDPRIKITIPANDIERMVIQDMLSKPVAYLDAHFKIAAFSMCLKLFRRANVALRVWRMFEQLTEFVSIAFRGFDLRGVLDCKKACLLTIKLHLPSCPKGNHDVVAFAEF